MAQVSPIIQNGILTDPRGGSPMQIIVNSSEWHAWLQTASTFTFRGEHGSFTARKERAGNRRGTAYWRAYRTWQGKLHRAYLGQSEELTLARLQSVAKVLANKGEWENALDVPGLEAGTGSSPEAASRAHLRRAARASSLHETVRSHPWLASFPVPLTALIGRDQEAQVICGLLSQPEVRLLTLTGTPGVGKTRLSLLVAAELSDTFANGVCFVSLAPLTDPDLVLPTLTQALTLPEARGRSPLEHLQACLQEKHLLLLLDNFEQVTGAALPLVALLQTCPDVKILVTSRALLHVRGEYEVQVLPLELPDPSQASDVELLTRNAAVTLFTQRAQALASDFILTEMNAPAIAEICTRLDGLPLAIELAATRIKLLSPPQLLSRLEHRLDVLTSGAQDLPVRQQTLRNTLQWSYGLLTPEEQRLFRWLSIFVGGCTLEAAEAVCQENSDQGFSMLEGIASLLDKSLVQQTERGGGEPRLVMLETLREFGLDCLDRQGELEAARQAHARYFLALAEAAEPRLFGPDQLQWLDRLKRELDNLRAILQTGVAGGAEEREVALRVASALHLFWHGRGYLREGRDVLERLLAGAGELASLVHLRVLITLGTIRLSQGDVRGLEQRTSEVLALAREQDDPWYVIPALTLRGAVLRREKHDYAAAQACLEEGVALAHLYRASELFLAWALANLGQLALYQREYARALAWFEQGLTVCRARGEKVVMSNILYHCARAELGLSHGARARALLEESLAVSREIGNTWVMVLVLHLLGQLAMQQGEMKQAEMFLTESIRLASELGDRYDIALPRVLLAGLAALQEEYAAARQGYEEGLATALEVGATTAIALGLKGLGCVAAAQGLPAWAAVLWGTAEPLPESPRVIVAPANYERMAALVRSQLGEPAFEEARAAGRALTPAQALASPERFSLQTTLAPTPAQPTPDPSLAVPMRRPSFPAGLTPREVEVLRLVARGLTDAQIAEHLVISPRTVTTHLTSIYNKLAVNSRVAAARFAIEHDLT